MEVRSTERAKGKEKLFSEETEFQKIKEEMERGNLANRRRVAEVEPTLNAMQQLNRLHNLGRRVALGELHQGDERRSKSRADRPSAQPPSSPQSVMEEHLEELLPEHNHISEEFDQPAQLQEPINPEVQEQQEVQPPVVNLAKPIPKVPPPTIPPPPSMIPKVTSTKEALPKQSRSSYQWRLQLALQQSSASKHGKTQCKSICVMFRMLMRADSKKKIWPNKSCKD